MNRTERFYKIDQLLHERQVVPIEVFLDELGVSRALSSGIRSTCATGCMRRSCGTGGGMTPVPARFRRSARFITGITGIWISVATPVVSATVPRKVELQRSSLAGFQYHQGEVVWSSLVEGTSLSLVREAGNAHDPRAVCADWQGQKLGYVPRIDHAAVSHLLDVGHVLQAEIVALQESDNPWNRVEFVVILVERG